ncbi:DUF7619 domain-containing protein [Flavobacterium sp.]|uniref:DUF7619 domain-containing protein n=1 Tax=Flavobacterium sp. TaxID=239 RepID=UPI003D6C25B0
MKKILLLLFLLTGIAQAQIVNIPDANLKTQLLQASPTYYIAKNLSGNFFKIDSNSDGEIQVAEASQVSYLYLREMNISNMTGIEDFVNVNELICEKNEISSLNISSLPGLRILRCGENNLSSIDVSLLGNLVQFDCERNQITTLNVSNLNNLFNFNCSHNQLSSLNVSNMAVLSQFFFNDNAITTIDLSANNSLRVLDCQNNQLSALNVSNLVEVSDISCYGNLFTNLNFQNLPQLKWLVCGNTQLTAVNLDNLPALKHLSIGGSGITSLNLSAHTGLTSLGIGGTSITAVDLSALVNLVTLDVSDNPNLLSLDLSSNSNLYNISIHSDIALTHINLKNGKVQNIDQLFYDTSLLSLQYICGDDAELGILQSEIDYFYAPYNISVNTYCSFTPGGNYNTISGNMIFDSNNNGCDIADLPQSFLKVKINDGTNEGFSLLNDNGEYAFHTQAGNFTLTPNVENPTFFIFSPPNAVINFGNNNNNNANQNFCITANGFHPDLEIVIAPIVPARPGFDAVYKIVYKNKGNQVMTQSYGINFMYNQNLMNFVSASQTPSSQGAGGISWDYANLMPFESRSITVTMNVNSPTATNPVNINDVLQLTATILPMAGDETTMDNLFQFNQTVVGSFDPNDKLCVEGKIISPVKIGGYLHYVINFENTGTAPAENIVVKDIIDTVKFDEKTLQVLDSSHPVTARISGNKVEFIFPNINLGYGGHGNILLKVRTRDNLIDGDAVENKADIFFDYNAPIETNVARTTFQSLGIDENTIDNAIAIYPNPTNGMIHIKSINTIQSVQLFDVQGRILMTRVSDEPSELIDLTSRAAGIYFIKISTEKGTKVERIIKK